ncbi:hypothetical protein Taro_031555 [Colocasia esculenta]|uniref:Uncharacterized protein n=1 Tax=Colocasia esculenta TaxID=4460 RepID=A0A843VJ45_COLES|nr:hypothetical protein [Colocasia esculenta]
MMLTNGRRSGKAKKWQECLEMSGNGKELLDSYGYNDKVSKLGWLGIGSPELARFWPSRSEPRNENYDNASEVLIGVKNVIKRMLDNEDRAIIACKQMHDYRLQLYHFGTSTAPRVAQILSPDIEDVFEEEHPLHAWVNATSSVEPEFDPHDRVWAEGELDDVPLLPDFETPPAPKRQKKTVGARGRNKKHGISIADLETIEEDVDDETSESSDNVIYQTSNDSTSKTSTPSEGSDHGGDVSSVPPPAPPPDPIVFTGEEDFTHATQDQHHGSRQGREAETQTSSQQYARKGKKVASQFQGQGQDQGRQASEDSGYNPNFIPHRWNWLMKKKKMQEEWERQEKLRMEFETMEQALDTSSYASTEGFYQGQGGYLAYPQYSDASYYTGGGAYAQSTESNSHSHDSYESYGSYQGPIQSPLARPDSARLGRAGGYFLSLKFVQERLDYLEDGKNVFKLRLKLCSSLFPINERIRDFFLEYDRHMLRTSPPWGSELLEAINSLKNVDSTALLQFLQPILNMLLHLIGDGGETLQVL